MLTSFSGTVSNFTETSSLGGLMELSGMDEGKFCFWALPFLFFFLVVAFFKVFFGEELFFLCTVVFAFFLFF